jgi:hypothetical protein
VRANGLVQGDVRTGAARIGAVDVDHDFGRHLIVHGPERAENTPDARLEHRRLQAEQIVAR